MKRVFASSRRLALLASFLFASALSAQTFGQINGSVSDPSGTVIPNAKISVKNLGTEAVREGVTQNNGSFSILSLLPARYSLTVTANGFQTYVVQEFRLQGGEARTFDINLKLGQVTETVEVNASVVAVNQTNATISTTIQQQEIVEIPLNGRNFAQLIQLSPGVSPAAVGQQTTFGITGGNSPAVNGMRHMMNNFTLDGVENNMRFTNSFGTPPPPDALEEFSVSSHQSDAGASLAAGANVNLVTRAGTNDFHGSAWNFLRNEKLSANGFFNNYFGRGRLPFRQNQFGFYLGGPVYIPKLLNGKKTGTYIMGYYEGSRFRRSSTTTATVPSDAVRSGNLSEFLGPVVGTDCLGRSVRQGQIYDPRTTRADASCPQGIVRDPFPNNQIPTIHPIAQAWLNQIYPRANSAGTPNLILAQSTQLDSDQWGVRADQNISSRQRLFGRVSKYSFERFQPNPIPNNRSISTNKGANVAINYNFIFSPTVLYEFVGGYNRATIPFGNEPRGKEFRDAVGADLSPEVPLGFLPSTQNLAGSRYNSASFVSYDLANPDDSFQFNNSLKKVKGSHSLSFGFNLLHWRHYVGVQGTSNLQYSPLTTGLPGFTTTGESSASFFLGLPTATTYGFGLPKKTYGDIFVGFAGDTWKVTPKLTLTMGLQYVYATPPVGNQVSAMDVELARTRPTATDFTFAYVWAEKNPITGADANSSRGLLHPDRNNFAPRLGLAYVPFKNTSIRAGFGLFYDYNTNLIQNNNARGFAYPFAVSRGITGQNLTTVNPNINLNTPYVPFTPSIAQFGSPLDPYRRDPYALTWNFGVEHMFGANLLLGVDYVGSGGRKLSTNVQLNQAPVGTGDINARRPWPNAGTNPFIIKHIGNSNYHSLQVKLERRFSRGLTFRNSYTWSRTMDYDSDPNSAQVSYTYNLRYSYGPATFHIPHVNTTSFLQQLPFGKGRAIGGKSGKLVDAIIGGWQLSGIISIRSGLSYHVLSGVDTGQTGNSIAASTERANIVGSPVPSGFVQNRDHWFDPAAFAVPAFGTLGNLSRNSLIGPAFQNVDVNFAKDFAIHERLKLQFRAEMFNLFNHVNFANPNATLGNRALLGQITGAYAARDIQFALKLHW
jgi:hypothetical protein